MKLIPLLLFAGCLAVSAETEEEINKRFAVQPGGKLVVDVDFGSIDISTNASSEVIVDIFRKISRRNKSSEEEFLRERPVTFSQDGNTVTIRSRAKSKMGWSWHGWQRTEGKYTITVPAQFNAQLKTSGGGIGVSDLSGETKADTSGGGWQFARLRGPLDGGTSGGGIRVADCEGALKVKTSGGGVSSDLPVTVVGKIAHDHLKGPVNGGGKPVVLRTSGGSI